MAGRVVFLGGLIWITSARRLWLRRPWPARPPRCVPAASTLAAPSPHRYRPGSPRYRSVPVAPSPTPSHGPHRRRHRDEPAARPRRHRRACPRGIPVSGANRLRLGDHARHRAEPHCCRARRPRVQDVSTGSSTGWVTIIPSWTARRTSRRRTPRAADRATSWASVCPPSRAGSDAETRVAVYADSPAATSDLRPHDAMLAVDGKPFWDEAGQSRTRGPEGTSVTLTDQRPGEPVRRHDRAAPGDRPGPRRLVPRARDPDRLHRAAHAHR